MPEFPPGWPRTRHPKRAQFDSHLTIARAIDILQTEVRRMGGHDLRIDTDLRLRQDGLPYSQQRQPDDQGAVVWFRRKGQPLVFACDTWSRIEHNLRAISKTLEAKRGIERWGCATAEREFQGYAALGDGSAPEEDPAEVLGVAPDASPDEVRIAWRGKMMLAHPDRPGGSNDQVHRLTKARDALLAQLEAQ